MQTLPAHYRHRDPLPRRPRYGLRRIMAALVAAGLVLMALFLVSLWGAWRTPGNENFQAKWADWLRSHHAALIAHAIEQYYYDHHVPPKGGRPAGLNAVPAPTRHQTVVAQPGLPRPGPVPLVVTPALPGEGQWTPAGAS